MSYKPLQCSPKPIRIRTSNTTNQQIENVQEEIEYLFDPCTQRKIEKYITIGNRKFHHYQLLTDSHILYSIARKQLRQAEDVIDPDAPNIPITQIYSYLIDLLKYTRHHHQTTQNNELKQNISLFEDSILHLTELEPSTLNKFIGTAVKNNESTSQYLHLYFDVTWLLLTLNETPDITQLITQLTYLSCKSYEKYKVFTSCGCIESLWLRLQLFCEHKSIDFWGCFNATLQCHDDEFSVKFVAFVAGLQCYNEDGLFVGGNSGRVVPNLEFFNQKWGSLMRVDVGVDSVLGYLQAVEDVVGLWVDAGKLDFLYATWDYFYKRLERFEIKGNMVDLVERVAGGSVGDCGYQLFLKLLHRHLRKHPQQWNKFRGRIYTRFSPSKFAKLNENGVFNLALLFLVVWDVNEEEINEKLLEFLMVLPHERQNSLVVWNIHISMIYLNLKNGKNIETSSSKFLHLLQEASSVRTQFNLITTFVSTMNSLMSQDLHLKQTVLFGPWMDNYTKSCQHSDLLIFLNTLILATERITEAVAWYEYQAPFEKYVLPALKRLSTSGVGLELVGTLAAVIATNCSGLEVTATHYASENVPPIIATAFFHALSKRWSFSNSSNCELIMLKAWLQCSLINDVNPEFSRFVLSLDVVKPLQLQLMSTQDSFVKFTEALAQSGDKEIVKVCFNGLERYVGKHLSTSSELTLQHIYTCMAVIFTSCNRLLYSRININCPLSKIIDVMFLPMEILRGQRPPDAILKAIEKTWHIYIFAIYAIAQNDAYLERILKDLIIRYIPHFQAATTPLLIISRDKNLLAFSLTKISNEFLLHDTARATDEQIVKVITAINTLVTKAPPDTLQIILSHTLQGLFEAYMFKNQKVVVVDILKTLVKSEMYQHGVLTDIIQSCLQAATKKHLPFNTNVYFQMMYVLTKIIPCDLKTTLAMVRTEIAAVEAKRGQGFDKFLQQGLERLIKLLQ